MGDLFKDLVESGSKKTVENFIYQNLAGTATMHNEIIGVFWSMNAQGDDDIVPDTVPDQVSGAVEDELDGDHLENVKMSYLPCVSRLSTRAGILCTRNFKPGKKPAKIANFSGESL